jgi:transmembrane 9 superfamily member 2/4
VPGIRLGVIPANRLRGFRASIRVRLCFSRLLRKDVFRPPAAPWILAGLVGVGIQVICTSGVVVAVGAAGLFPPENPGVRVVASLLAFAFLGVIAGYSTTRTYKMLGGANWQRVTLIPALGFPGLNVAVLLSLNTLVYFQGSVSAVPLQPILAVLSLWLFVSVPLTFIGTFFGFKADRFALPVRASEIATEFPAQSFFKSVLHPLLVGGIVPIGIFFVEFFFVMVSVWRKVYYQSFGYLLFTFVLVIWTSAATSITMTNYLLCSRDYRWWWRSALIPAASGVSMYAYCIFFFSVNSKITGLTPQIVYFVYMGLGAIAFAASVGAVGFLATLVFMCRIFSFQLEVC